MVDRRMEVPATCPRERGPELCRWGSGLRNAGAAALNCPNCRRRRDAAGSHRLADGDRHRSLLEMAIDRPGSVVVGDLDEVPWNIGSRSVPVELSVVRSGDAARRGRQRRREVAVHPAEVRTGDVGAVMSVIDPLAASVIPKPRSRVEIHMVSDHPIGAFLTPDRPLELRRDGRRGGARRWRGRRASVPAGPNQTADRETADRETADRETADRETADRETGGCERRKRTGRAAGRPGPSRDSHLASAPCQGYTEAATTRGSPPAFGNVDLAPPIRYLPRAVYSRTLGVLSKPF